MTQIEPDPLKVSAPDVQNVELDRPAVPWSWRMIVLATTIVFVTSDLLAKFTHVGGWIYCLGLGIVLASSKALLWTRTQILLFTLCGALIIADDILRMSRGDDHALPRLLQAVVFSLTLVFGLELLKSKASARRVAGVALIGVGTTLVVVWSILRH